MKRTRETPAELIRFFSITLLMVLPVDLGMAVEARAETSPWSLTEQFVLQRIQADDVADLMHCPANAGGNRITSAFVAKLLTRWQELLPGRKEPPRAVCISHALIQGK